MKTKYKIEREAGYCGFGYILNAKDEYVMVGVVEEDQTDDEWIALVESDKP